jgi:hypothetical protein
MVPALWPVYRDVEELLAERGIVVDQVKPRSYTAL